MGETAQLNGTRAGQFGLNDFLGQQDNAATPRDLLRTIVPTQEMRAFQRVYKFDSAEQLLAIGERWTVTWVVPQREWWRPLAIQWFNGDTVVHFITVSAAIDRVGAIQSFQASEISINANHTQLVYGLDGQASSLNEFFGRFPLVLQPGDILTAGDATPAIVANNPQYTLVYELMPQPATPNTRGLVGTISVT